LNIILKHHSNGDQLTFKKQKKSTRGLHNGASDRRSQYIGVLKYKEFWQALINVGKTKRYIGTFQTEMQAALAYDFYSIGLHYTNAKINFTYTVDELVPLITEYYNSNREFSPSKHSNLQSS
jgi:hypothetical protein